MEFNFGQIEYLLLLLLLPVLGFLFYYFRQWRQKKRELFADERFRKWLFGADRPLSKFIPIALLLSLFFIILALANPRAGKEKVKTLQKTSNVIFLVDVSNSMNAEDVEPSRMEQAKNILKNVIPQLGSDKVGIVIFAGDAVSIMPLTTDVSAADTYLSAIQTNMMKVQGTDYLRGMEMVVTKFKNVPKGARQLFILSDGEDNEGNDEAARKLANEEDIQVNTVGIGTEDGAPVPVYLLGQLMEYKSDETGQTVISKRQTLALKNLADQTGGQYIDGNRLDEAVEKIKNQIQSFAGGSTSVVSTENSILYYQYPLAAAVVILLFILLINKSRDFDF